MSNEKTLFSFAQDIEDVAAQLEQINLQLDVLDEQMEESYHLVDKPEALEAVNFVRRLPMRLALLRVAQRDLGLRIKELDAICVQLREVTP